MPSSPDDLCILADLKAWLNIQSSAEDTLLQNLITRGSLQMLRWMNRDHIITTPYTENRDGNDAVFILPRNFPLVSVSNVMVDNISIPAATSQVSSGFVFDARRIMLRGGSSAFYSLGPYSGTYQYRFTRGFQNVQFVYQAGYASVPADLQQAAIEGFAYVYRRRTHIGEDASSASGQVTISFSKEMLPASVLMTLEQYTRRALA
ncbi:MAG: hypothetical protein DMG64_02360 [Acidobacteria bacterium]|nr:MAG: hypothetical protein DMG64_02360 [Acidobacteriota bacterium]